jgi:CBS domain-containing protein
MRDNIQVEFNKLYERWEWHLKLRYPEGEDMREKIKKFYDEEMVKCRDIKVSREDLENLRQLRNINAHSPSFLEIKPIAIQKLKIIVNTFCRKAIDIATPEKKIFSGTLNSDVDVIVKFMNEKLYTHVPITDGKKFIGVFSENTLLKLIAMNLYKPNIKMREIERFLKASEGKDDYLFLPLDVDFFTVYKLFQDYIEKGKRLGVVFLTKNGKPSGQIKGLITAWDLHKGII